MRRFWQSIAGASGLVLALASTLATSQDQVLRAALTGLLEYATAHPGLAAMLYVVFAASGMLTPFPSALIVMLIGGFLFGPIAGGMLSAAGATLSAGVVYRLGRSLFAASARKILGKRLLTAEKAMASHPLRYLLMLRLLPIVPAWIANLVPVLFRLPLRTVMFATFVGILPMCVVSGSLGSSLRSLDEIGDQVPQVLLSRWYLLALLFSLVLLVFLSSTARRRIRASPSIRTGAHFGRNLARQSE
jgi:uncharacterized membrane protein YdjX (TVP38/TMEM64 family)